MLIDNPDALKTWLTATLEPLCDADPAALSKYVLALVKKEKPMDELKDCMRQQMDVFLQGETEHFVDEFFAVLHSKDYLDPPAKKEEVVELAQGVVEASSAEQRVRLDDDISGGGAKQPDSTTTAHEKSKHDDDVEKASRPSSTGKRFPPSEGPLDDFQHRSGARSRSSREGRRSPRGRRFSRRSPPSPPASSYGRRFRERSPGSFRRIRTRSPTRDRATRDSSYSPPPRRSRLSPSRSSPPSTRRHLSPNGGRIDDASAYTPSSGPSLPSKLRCRDYDEKGFCMRGDQCKFDHGHDALILEDNNVRGSGGVVVPSYNPDTSLPPPSVVPPPSHPTYTAEPYVPAPPVASSDPGTVVLPPLHLPPPGYPAQIPSQIRHERKRPYTDGVVSSYPVGSHKRRSGFRRFGGGEQRVNLTSVVGSRNPSSMVATKLAVRNIPPDLNNIGLLHTHFGKFGTLVNVQVHFEGDPASALVTFSNPREASAALSSPDSVLGNRFIRVFPHKSNDYTGVKSGDVVALQGNTITKTICNKEGDAQVTSHEAQKVEQKAVAIAAIKKNQEALEAKATMKKAQELKKAEAAKKIQDLRLSKQELLDKQLQEQRNIIAKLDGKKGNLKPEERSQMVSLVKSLSVMIGKTKEELEKLVNFSVVKNKTLSEIQKELLDAELELITVAEQDSPDAMEIKKRISELNIQAAKHGGILPTSKSPRGSTQRGRGFSPRGRGFYGVSRSYRGSRGRGTFSSHGNTTVDRRPCKIKVTGYDADDKEAILSHFRLLGEIVDVIVVSDGCGGDNEGQEEGQQPPSVILHYKTRRDAEVAMANGKSFGEEKLQLSWFTGTSQRDFQSQASSEETVGSEAASDLLAADDDDDYTPLDPTYLPPGLGEDDDEKLVTDQGNISGKVEEEVIASDTHKKNVATDEQDEPVGEDLNEDLLEEEDEDDEERSWKR